MALKGSKHTEEEKRIISLKLKGRKFTKEHRQKISMALKGKSKSEQAKLNMRGTKGRDNPWNKGIKRIDNIGSKNPNWTGGKTKCSCVYCGKTIYRSKYRIQNSKSLFCNGECYHVWCIGKKQSDEHILRKLSSLKKRPTKPENLFNKMTPDNVKYVGNGKWFKKLPNGKYKNPDFKVKGQDKVIEIFGNYWHRKGMPYDNPQELIDLYEQIGIDCLVVWESEIYGKPELVLNEISKFMEV